MSIWSQGRRRGGAGTGGGLTLGPPTNSFNGATRAAAETARDTYATANATWLAQYDDEPTFLISLTWPVVPANTVYQSRRSSAWADVTPLIRGPAGADSTVAGPAGPGVPTGGASEDVLRKASATDNDTEWFTPLWQTSAQVLDLIANPAEEGNTDTWPAAKLPAATTAAQGAVRLGSSVDLRTDANRGRAAQIGSVYTVVREWLANRVAVPTISGQVLTFTDFDGDTHTVTLPTVGGGSDTAAQILTKLLTVDGTGSGLDADLLDGMTPAEVAALGGGGGSQNYYPIDNANVGGTANAITLTTGQTLTALTGGMLFFFNSTNTNTGATTVNVDGIGVRNIQRSRPRGEGANINTGSEPLEGGEITNSDPVMVVYGSQFNEFYLLPSRAGTAAYRNVGTSEFDVPSLGSGGDLADGVIPAGIARTTALAAYAALTGATFTGAVSGITPTVDAHLTTKAYVDAAIAAGTPAQTHLNYIAISADNAFGAAEFTDSGTGASSMTPSLVVPTFSGVQRFIAIAVPNAQGDITDILQGGVSTFGAWVRIAGTITIGGEAHKVWRTVDSQNDLASGLTYVIEQ